MSKLYYNHICGNNYEGYPLKYVNDNDEEFDFKVVASVETTENIGNIHIAKFVNNVPKKIAVKTAITSGMAEFASNMSFFDPMSVSCIGRSKKLPYKNEHANFAFAFPGALPGGFYALNHHLSEHVGYDNYYSPVTIFPRVSWNVYGDPRYTQYFSVVPEEYKKDLFTMGRSTNILTMEEQFGKSWDEICDDKSLSSLYVTKYAISTNEFVNDERISLSYGSYKHIVPRGGEWESTQYDNPYYNVGVIDDSRAYGGFEDTWVWYDDGIYKAITSGRYAPEVKYSEGLPSASFKFVDEVFILTQSNSIYQNNLMLPIFNDNDMDELFITLFGFTNSSSIPCNISPYNIYLAYTGKTKIYKNKEKEKWILDFATPFKMRSASDDRTYNAGHYECPLSASPWDTPNNMKFTYINPQGKAESSPSVKLWRYDEKGYSTQGVPIPEFLGDKRFAYHHTFENFTGIHARKSDQLFYPDNFFKNKGYVCTDSGSYTILI